MFIIQKEIGKCVVNYISKKIVDNGHANLTAADHIRILVKNMVSRIKTLNLSKFDLYQFPIGNRS
jgi:hypothetical protein